MKLNGIDVKLDFNTKKDIKMLKKAFDMASSKSKKLENKLKNGIITQEKSKEKEISLIKNFFETILTNKDAQKLLATCSNYEDYYKLFKNFVQIVCTTSILLGIPKKLKKK